MDFLDNLLADLGQIAAEIGAALAYLFELIVSVFIFLWNVLVLVAQFFLGLMGDIGKFFAHIWDNFFKGIFTRLLTAIGTFGKWLHAIFGPVVKFLRNVSRYIDRIYNRYARPILRILRIARVFLTLLRALGIKWAGKLDSILGKIQTDIQRAFLTVKQYLNVMIDLLNILADPSNLLRRPTTLLSLRRIFHAFIRQVTGVPPGFFLPSPSKFAPPGLGFLPANFDPRDPLQNPPPSYYLAYDGGVQDFSFLAPGDTIDDGAVDDVEALDYFSSDAYPGPDCIDIASCRDDLVRASQGALAGG